MDYLCDHFEHEAFACPGGEIDNKYFVADKVDDFQIVSCVDEACHGVENVPNAAGFSGLVVFDAENFVVFVESAVDEHDHRHEE